MRWRRSCFLFISVMLLALTLVVAPAGAAKPPVPKVPKLLKLSVHSSFAGNEPITFRWKTDRAMARGQNYTVTLGTNGIPERDGPACSTPLGLVRHVGSGTPRGRVIVVRFPVPKTGRWCPSRLASVDVDGSGRNLGRAGFTIRDSRGLLPPEGMIWGRLTFGPSSTITVKVPGRPDRTAPFTGQIDQDTYTSAKDPFGFIGERLFVNSSGTVAPGALPADPLCTAAPITPLTVDRSTTLQFPGVKSPVTPPAELTLVLRAGAAALTGCAGDEPAPALTAVLLKGDPNASPTRRMSGSIDGVRLAGGAVASVVLDLEMGGPTPPIPPSA